MSTSSTPFEASQLYNLLEATALRLPLIDSAPLRPAELARSRDLVAQTWVNVRSFLDSHQDSEERHDAASYLGQFGTASLHLISKLPDPPVELVSMLLECNPSVASWQDSNGWLPLHHACANGASADVLAVIIHAFPMGKVTQDRRMRTPLHFAFFRANSKLAGISSGSAGTDKDEDDEGTDENSIAEIVKMLADSGAAELRDEGGMLPMHYAATYGTTEKVLQVLQEQYPDSITTVQNRGRNPLHLAMVNAHRKSSPIVVKFLLEHSSLDALNVDDDDNNLPIQLLSMASKFPAEKVTERNNASECLNLYLDAEPIPTPVFLTAIQTLPEWLRDIAVMSDHIQNILNQKIVKRFPTMIYILDFFFLILAIVLFEVTTGDTIDYFFTADTANPMPKASTFLIIISLFCAFYYLLREVVQMISMIALGNFSSWLSDMSNWLDVLVTFSVIIYDGIMLSGEPLVSREFFRNGTAITKGILWCSIISFLKGTLVEFSVFVSGVFYVVQQLSAFLLAMIVILLMFAQMFYLVYANSDLCQCSDENPDASPFPHCTFSQSLLKVYTMMMGEIGNEMRYSTNSVAQFLYVAFAFLVVILLSNVLIAIVTDSYGVIKNERAAMVFWSNRLDYVAEMDAIISIGKRFWCGKKNVATAVSTDAEGGLEEGSISFDNEEEDRICAIFRARWKGIMNLFDPNLYETYDVSPTSFEFWCYVLLRFVVVVFVIPLWLVLGLCTAGWFWPPQVREYLFQQKRAAASRGDISEKVTAQISDLKDEIQILRREIKSEMKNDRKEFLLVKAEVESVQAEVVEDLLQVKEIMVTLLDLCRDNLGSR